MAGASCAVVLKAAADIKFKGSPVCLFENAQWQVMCPVRDIVGKGRCPSETEWDCKLLQLGLASCLGNLHAPHNFCKAA